MTKTSYPKIEYADINYQPMPEEIKLIIGHLCDRWASLEIIIDEAIFKLSKVDNDTGYILLGRTQLKGKLAILSNLEKFVKHKERPADLKLALSKIDDVSAARNSVVHGLYVGTNKKKPDRHLFFTPANQYHDDETSGSRSLSMEKKDLERLCNSVEWIRMQILAHYVPDWPPPGTPSPPPHSGS